MWLQPPLETDTKHMSIQSPLRSISQFNATANMRVIQWASFALLSLATSAERGDSNLTHSSRNILPSTFTPPKHWRNVNLVRNINLEKSYAKETLNVVIENVDKEAQQEYFLPFEVGTLGRIGGLEVRDKKDPEREGFTADVVEVDPLG